MLHEALAVVQEVRGAVVKDPGPGLEDMTNVTKA